MSRYDDDIDLRERFAALRRADAEHDPGFADVMRPERARPGSSRDEQRGEHQATPRGWSQRRRGTSGHRAWLGRAWVPALMAAAALAALWLVLPSGSERTDPRIEPPQFSFSEWSMPTDVLLDLSGVPGDALLRDLPEFAVPPAEIMDGAHIHYLHQPTRRHAT